MVPVEVLAVLDAVCTDEGKDRTKKVNEILRAWAQKEYRRASLVMNVSRGNPSLLDDMPSDPA